jgi:hypothetical protein
MGARWDEGDDERRRELDATRMELCRIRETTACDCWNYREQRWELDDERQRLVRSAIERHPCLSDVLKEARRVVEREAKEHLRRADRIETELGAGSTLSPEEKLRRNVHKWRAGGLLGGTDGKNTSGTGSA